MIEKDQSAQIKVKNVSVIYNKDQPNEVRALKNANLELYPQEYVIIFGPSGCGKSTLLYAIAGLQGPTKGKVIVDSDEIYSLEKKEKVKYHQHKIGMIFQAFHLIPSINVVDNICLPKAAAGEGEKERNKVSRMLLERFGILNQAKKFPSELSGGQKQRVSIARSLANNPDIILADEPVGNLDSASAHNVMTILQELNEKDKKTIILVTHDPSHLRYGDRIIYLRDGKIIKEEIVKKKVSASDEDPIEEIVTERVPPDLRMLMKAFKSLSTSQAGSLLHPFKAQQLMSHALISLTQEQLERTTIAIREMLTFNSSYEQLLEALDNDYDSGGAGWDKRKAHSFIQRISKIIDQANNVDLDNPESATKEIIAHFSSTFNLLFSQTQKDRLAEIIAARLKSLMSVKDVQEKLDFPLKDGGAGLDRRTAHKIARELEIILLVQYGK